MTLDHFLTVSGLSCAEFGAKCSPPIHRTEVWKIRRGERSPGALKVNAIEVASGYQVRAPDLIKTNRKRKSRHKTPRKVANP